MTDVSLESPLRWLGGLIDIKVEAEADTPGDWVDITEHVERVTTRTGQEKWGNRFNAGTATIRLDNTAGYFTPATGTSLSDLTWRPGLTIRIRALPDPEDPDVSHSLFTGRVQSSTDSYDAATGDVTTEVRLLDVLADLHQFNPPALDTPMPSGLSTSERVHAALNRAGFPPSRRLVQGGVHSMQRSALAQSTLEECQRAADAEGGAFFADPDNNVVFAQRDWLVGGGPSLGFYETEILKLGPVAYWRFSGDGTWDSSGNGHHITWESPPASASGVTPEDRSIRFPLLPGKPADPDPLGILVGDLTIEGRFNSGNISDAYTLIKAEGTNKAYEVGYSPTGGGTLFFDADWLTSPFGIDFIDGLGWIRFTFTLEWSGSNYELTAYLNGDLFNTATGTASPLSPASRDVEIAQAATGDGDARLSELAVFSYALTAEDIDLPTDLPSRPVNVQARIGFPDGPPVVDARVSWDVARVRNHITFARTGGTVQVAEDATSQAAYGVRTYQRLDLQNNSNAQVLTLAQRALASWKDARIRVDQVTIAARESDPDLHKLFYDCQIGDLVEVRVNPRPGFTYDTEAHVIGIGHTITPSDWVVTLTLDDAAVAQEP